MKSLNREDVLAICEMINGNGDDKPLPKETLEDAFNARWPDFEKSLPDLLNLSASSPAKAHRTDRELLEEILNRVRSLGVPEDIRDKELWHLLTSALTQRNIREPWFTTADMLRSGIYGLPSFTFPSFSSVESLASMLVPKFRSALDQLDTDVWPMLSTAANTFIGGFWVFNFPSSDKDVFDLLKTVGPKHDAIRTASRVSGVKIKLICEGEEISFDAT